MINSLDIIETTTSSRNMMLQIVMRVIGTALCLTKREYNRIGENKICRKHNGLNVHFIGLRYKKK